MMDFSPRRLSYLVNELREYGVHVDSERGPTLEIENIVLKISNPRDRIASEEWRKMNVGFAIVDALSHIVGDNTLGPLTQFVPSFVNHSTNGRTIDGSYGNRIHTNEQLGMLIELLKKNPQTRRAALSIYMGPVDLAGGGGKNTPCTLGFHFLVRNGRLNMKVMMRSNDILLGFTNDIFTFTFLHEYVSVQTGIPMGDYIHYASSFHLYESDLERLSEARYDGYNPYVMAQMPTDFNPNRLFQLLKNLSPTTVEGCLQTGLSLESDYERSLYFATTSVYHRKKPNVKTLVEQIYDRSLKTVVEYWTQKEYA